MKLLERAIVVIAFTALIAACGTKGPLYVPGIPVNAQWPYPTTAPTPEKPDQKPANVPGTSDDKK